MSIARIKVVILFLIAVLAAMVFWRYLFAATLIHHASNPAAQGAATLTS